LVYFNENYISVFAQCLRYNVFTTELEHTCSNKRRVCPMSLYEVGLSQ